MKNCIIILFFSFVFLISHSLNAQITDTLFNYIPNSPGATTPGYNLQIARFDLPAPCTLTTVRVKLSGTQGTTCRLRIFGHEGGTAFPQFLNDLVTPVTLTKLIDSDEWMQVSIPPVSFINNQFFIGMDSFSIGGFWLGDTITRQNATCESSSGGNYWYQFMRDSVWRSGRKAFLCDAIVIYPTLTSQNFFTDVTTTVGLDTSFSNASVSWGDYDGDGFLDLLVSGRLFKNNNGISFSDVTLTAGLMHSPRVSGFLDVDNDEDLDLVFIGLADSANAAAVFVNDGSGQFTKIVQSGLFFPQFKAPNGLSIADYNLDKFPDVFVPQLWSVYPNAEPNFLLLNLQNNRFQDESFALSGMPAAPNRRSRASQWVDYNNDGWLDLYVTNYFLERDELWQNDGTGSFLNVIVNKTIDRNNSGSNHGTGCDWMDYDNDGDMDLLLGQLAHPGFMLQYDHRGTTLYNNDGPPNYDFTDMRSTHAIQYEETHSGGAWGDLNNDGLVDMAITTYYGCRYMDMYLQKPDHSFEMRSFDFNTWGIVTGQDVAFADFDNDGDLDMLGGKNDALHLFRNNSSGLSHWVELDLKSCTGNSQAIGARVWLYAGGKIFMQEVTAGRGQRMQKPTRLHFGLGNITSVDSIVVRWPDANQSRELFTNIAVDQLNTVQQVQCVVSNQKQIENAFKVIVYPNPVTDFLNFDIHLSGNSGKGFLEIVDLSGRIVFNEKIQGKEGSFLSHESDVRHLPAGLYIYRVKMDSGQSAFGKITKL